MAYLESLYSQLKKRNESIETYQVFFKWYNKLIEENESLRTQLLKCHDFIERNTYECRNDIELAELQQNNKMLINYKFPNFIKHKSIDTHLINQSYF